MGLVLGREKKIALPCGNESVEGGQEKFGEDLAVCDGIEDAAELMRRLVRFFGSTHARILNNLRAGCKKLVQRMSYVVGRWFDMRYTTYHLLF